MSEVKRPPLLSFLLTSFEWAEENGLTEDIGHRVEKYGRIHHLSGKKPYAMGKSVALPFLICDLTLAVTVYALGIKVSVLL